VTLSRSLRLRLLGLAAVAISFALFLSGAVLVRLFTHHVEEREFAELANHQNQIIAALQIEADDELVLTTAPADPRFSTPNGGLYWQIEQPNGGSTQRSRSLWETVLELPPDTVKDGSPHRHTIVGPNRTTLLGIERGVTIGPDTKPRTIRLTVAVDRHEVDIAVADFRQVLAASLGVLGLTLLAALLVQIEVGLRPLARLRTALQRVHTGSIDRVTGIFPSEVQPLIEDMNALLDRERQNNQRARERAADLAHGFKTPLAVLSTVSRDLVRTGRPSAAGEIDTQIDMMGRHVRRELARARTVGSSAIGQQSVHVRPVLVKIVAALNRISADRVLAWTLEVADDVVFFGDENDLLELVGNLADNAAKWAVSKVYLCAHQSAEKLILKIEDDGPGIPDGAESEVLIRGRRLDETSDGTGLGLAIVARIAEAYGGEIEIDRSTLGGLRATVALPGLKDSIAREI
jgi:signal transduction histidine kinase